MRDTCALQMCSGKDACTLIGSNLRWYMYMYLRVHMEMYRWVQMVFRGCAPPTTMCRLIQYRGSTESVEMGEMSPEEQDLILRIRRLQGVLQVNLSWCVLLLVNAFPG